MRRIAMYGRGAPAAGAIGVFGIIVCIVYFIFCGIMAAWIASQKGYSGGLWFFLGLIFNVIAILAIGFCENVYREKKLLDISNYLKKMADAVTAPPSGTVSSSSAPRAGVLGGTWICKTCGTENPATASSCKGCGLYR
jgi:hypothetical protein